MAIVASTSTHRRAFSNAIRRIVPVVFALHVASCGTVISQRFHQSGGEDEVLPHMGGPPNVVFGGVTTDVAMIYVGSYAACHGELAGLLLVPFFLADTAPSLIADTLLLPMTIPEQIESSGRDDD